MKRVFPVLLAGGFGSRLWPLSRKSYPKQFSNLLGSKTLFQQSALRLVSSDQVEFEPHITITNSNFRFIVAEQLQAVELDPGRIILEPESKNTAASILTASLFAYAEDSEAILVTTPCDHIIPDTAAFHAAVKIGIDYVQAGKIVTFGVYPTQPETGYGYLELAENEPDNTGVTSVVRFVEKPESSHAKKMLSDGNYLWNSGIFLFKAADMIAAFKTFAPNTLELTKTSIETANVDLGFLRLDPESWTQLEDISIDYAIMEKAKNLVAVPYLSKWSDLGDWDAVLSESEKDHSGSAFYEGSLAIDCSNTLIRSESKGQTVVGLGLDDIIVVAMPDAVLVAKKGRGQEVKQIVDLLKAREIAQADNYPKDYRPWGWFESVALGDRFQVKRIYIKPGATLSLQSHNHRSEHWVVVEGTAKATLEDEIRLLTEGQSIYIPLGAIHRLENPGKIPLVIIEVQTGPYLGEDDIFRFDDVYSRC